MLLLSSFFSTWYVFRVKFHLIYLRKKHCLCKLCNCMRSESMELWGHFLLFFVKESGPIIDRKEVRLGITHSIIGGILMPAYWNFTTTDCSFCVGSILC